MYMAIGVNAELKMSWKLRSPTTVCINLIFQIPVITVPHKLMKH